MIEALVGRPYVEPFGCFLIVREALEMLGKAIPDYTAGLSESARLAALQDGLATHATPVDSPERGDVVLLKVMGEPGHIGIMISPREMLHCMKGTNACIERIDGVRWRGRVLGYWRPSGMPPGGSRPRLA